MLVPVLTVLPLFRGASRPPVDGTARELGVDGFFRIHYTLDGSDAVDADDLDDNGVPDVVDTVRDALSAARAGYVADGWRPLVGDGEGDGGDEIDVYLRRLEVYGYATPVPAGDGTSSCYLQLDPDNQVAGRVMESVVWHELHHCVQFRYTANTVSWLYESGATYQQYKNVKDAVLDYAAALLWVEWLTHPERPLSATDGRREYAAFVFTKLWAEREGPDPTRLPRLWEALGDPTGDWIDAVDRAAIVEWGDDLDAVFLDHATWNAFACATDDGAHYAPDTIPCIATTSVPAPPFVDGETVRHDEEPYTAAYRTLSPGVDGVDAGTVRVTCTGPGSNRLVSVDADGQRVADVDGDDLQLTFPDGGSAVLVYAGTGARRLARTCALATPTRAESSGGCSTTALAPGSLALVGGLVLLRRRRR